MIGAVDIDPMALPCLHVFGGAGLLDLHNFTGISYHLAHLVRGVLAEPGMLPCLVRPLH